jgi:hypothetical protein
MKRAPADGLAGAAEPMGEGDGVKLTRPSSLTALSDG